MLKILPIDTIESISHGAVHVGQELCFGFSVGQQKLLDYCEAYIYMQCIHILFDIYIYIYILAHIYIYALNICRTRHILMVVVVVVVVVVVLLLLVLLLLVLLLLVLLVLLVIVVVVAGVLLVVVVVAA